jgi:hypothetical protein
MPSFQIGDAPTKVELQPAAAAGARPSGTVSFPVRNLTAKAQTGRIRVEPLGGAKPEWFAIEGAAPTSPTEIERDFDPSGNHVAVVKLTPPVDAAPGEYTFQLRVTAEHDPDTDVVTGPAVGFKVAPPPPAAAPATSFPWWAVAVAAVLVLVIGGVVGYFVMSGGDDGTQVAVPAVKGRSHVEAAQAVAGAGFGAVFTLTTEGDVQGLQAVSSDPEEGDKAEPGSNVSLRVKSPTDGPCNSVICSFPNQAFPPQVISVLAAQNFDAKFAPALSVSGGKVAIDDAKFAAILNPPVNTPVTRVRLPRLQNLDITEASNIILDLGLTIEAVAVADGSANGQVQRSIPAGPAEVDQGESVVVLYRPKPKSSCKHIYCQLGTIKVKPDMSRLLRENGYSVDLLNQGINNNQRITIDQNMFRQR